MEGVHLPVSVSAYVWVLTDCYTECFGNYDVITHFFQFLLLLLWLLIRLVYINTALQVWSFISIKYHLLKVFKNNL